jgi:LacI family transcriptional regulator
VFLDVAAAETRLRAAGYAMLLTNSESDPSLDAAHIRLFEQRQVDGLILSLTSETHEETNRLLEQLEIPCVLVDRDLPPWVAVSRVLYDHQIGMRQAVAHLLNLGHRRIGLLIGPPVRVSRERRLGFEAEFASSALPPTYTIAEVEEFDSELGERAMADLLDSAEPTTAVVVGSNQILAGALKAIAARGLEIPRDLSLVSCDDVTLTEVYRPALAVVRRDNAEVGRESAEMLIGRIQHNEAPRDIVLPTEFLPRESCAPPLTLLS